MADQRHYRGYTLLMFEARLSQHGVPPERHWIVIAPDGINIVGAAMRTEAEARDLVDSRWELQESRRSECCGVGGGCG